MVPSLLQMGGEEKGGGRRIPFAEQKAGFRSWLSAASKWHLLTFFQKPTWSFHSGMQVLGPRPQLLWPS